MSSERASHRVVVSLGTDYHRFDRLVGWTEDWLSAQPAPPSCLIQHGASAAPRYGEGVFAVPRPALLDLYDKADVVIVQGGPGSILDARSVGQLPIAVPRAARFGEAVDDHQLAFTAEMARQGECIMATTADQFTRAVQTVLAGGQPVRTPRRAAGAVLAASRLGEVIALSQSSPVRVFSWRRARKSWALRETGKHE